MSPEDGRGLNCFFHMPFADGARIEVTSEMGEEDVILFYYVDHEAFDHLDEGLGRLPCPVKRTTSSSPRGPTSTVTATT
jgi:hypothetical protein